MNKIIITSILISTILFSGCKKVEEEPIMINELLTVSGDFFATNYHTHLFLSDQLGKIISCEKHDGAGPTALTSETVKADDYFDFSLVRAISTDQNILHLETYPNIQRDKWQFKIPMSDSTNAGAGIVTFLADDLADNIEYALVRGHGYVMTSMIDLKTDGSMTIEFDLEDKFIFIRFRMSGEQQYRYVQFDNLVDGQTINLDIASYPLGTLSEIESSVATPIKVKSLSGLRIPDSFKNSNNIYKHNVNIQDYVLPEGKVWYPEGIYDSFFVQIEAKHNNFEYLLENRGEPIYVYNPTPPSLNFEGDRNGFNVTSNDPETDFVSATWAIEKPEGSIEWTIFQKVNEISTYTLPDFPTCLPFDDTWFPPNEFVLKSIQSYHYQNFENYADYINSRYGDDEGGEGTRLILAGGNYERKSILQ